MWKSYKQERGCLAHFLRLLAVWWPGAQSAQDNHALACNYAKYSPILMSSRVYTCFVMNEESIANEAVVYVCRINVNIDLFLGGLLILGGSVAQWLACWTQAQKGQGSNRSRDAVG